MSERASPRRTRNPAFIDGIHNYCDRWCERCAFTARCRAYEMEQRAGKSARGQAPDRAAFWKQLEDQFKLTRNLLLVLLKERGMPLPSEAELKAAARTERRREGARRRHPLAVQSQDYARQVDGWFETQEPLLRRRTEEIRAQARLGVPGVKEAVVSLTDCVEIIRWYQFQIHVKLMRGLDREGEEDLPPGTPKDSDGSVKVALIAIDRSISAWLRLKESFPEKTDDILSLLLALDRLRRRAEAGFPNARAFVRPGFDAHGKPEDE
jgi:hypothetical protein